MQAQRLAITDVICLTPKVFGDDRGFFFESFDQRVFEQALGQPAPHFVQDKHSSSAKGALRGLHYQIQQPQGKLVRVTQGEVFDFAVDIRKSSPTFGEWVGEILSEQNKKQIWVPPGFAHGFLVVSETAEFLDKNTDFWAPKFERCIAWNDPRYWYQVAAAWHHPRAVRQRAARQIDSTGGVLCLISYCHIFLLLLLSFI